METRTWILLLLCMWMKTVSSQESLDPYRHTTAVMDGLLNEARYDKRLRPYHQQGTAEVILDMSIVSIGEVKEIEMDYAMDIFLRQSWKDPRLVHNLSVPILLKDAEKYRIWLPDTYFQNAKTAKFFSVPSDNSRVVVSSDGQVLYGARIAVTASCEMDLRRYPLDTQHCNLELLSFSYPKKEILYKWQNEGSPLDVINDKMAEYQLMKTSTSSFEIHYPYAGTYRHLLAHLHFHRRIEYSLIQIYGPTCIIVILSWLSFWIPQSAVPARIALGITTLLTIVTLLSSIRGTVPKVSYVKAIDWYLIPSFMFVFGTILEYIFALIHVRRSKHKKARKTPDKERDGTCEIALTIVDDQDGEAIVSQQEHFGKPYSTQTMRKKSILQNLIEPSVSSCSDEQEEEQQVVNPVDKAARIIFPLSYIIFNFIYIVVYST